MAKNNSVYLTDMLAALDKIKEYTFGIAPESLLNESMRLDAIIRQMEILGEAANHLDDAFRDTYPNFPVREAAAMRNFLIHDYGNVNIETVWQTILEDLPLVEKQIKEILV